MTPAVLAGLMAAACGAAQDSALSAAPTGLEPSPPARRCEAPAFRPRGERPRAACVAFADNGRDPAARNASGIRTGEEGAMETETAGRAAAPPETTEAAARALVASAWVWLRDGERWAQGHATSTGRSAAAAARGRTPEELP